MECYRALKMSYVSLSIYIRNNVEGKNIIEVCVQYDIIYTKYNHMQAKAFIHICVIKG